jgi:hypothetical protein
MGSRPPRLPAGPWKDLLGHALTLVDGIAARGTTDPFWTFGGGTVLMLRYQHRRSKDIDIFVPDPQYLGYVSPRLSDLAESRDLFDLSLVIERNPEPLRRAAKFLVRHRAAFIRQLEERETVLRAQFDAIDVLNYRPAYDDASARAKAFLESLPAAP